MGVVPRGLVVYRKAIEVDPKLTVVNPAVVGDDPDGAELYPEDIRDNLNGFEGNL